MVYQMRTRSGQLDPYSTLAWVDQAGTVHQSHAFRWRPLGHWTSPDTGGVYPIESELESPEPHTGRSRRFRIRPLLAAQEIVGRIGSVDYWEGACEVLDEQGELIGQAYVELTGYARASEFRDRMRPGARAPSPAAATQVQTQERLVN